MSVYFSMIIYQVHRGTYPPVMKAAVLITAIMAVSMVPSSSSYVEIVDDISVISQYWGQITPYKDNKANYFGVEKVGLPNGCGIEQVHVLHRWNI